MRWHFTAMATGCLIIGFTLCFIMVNLVVHENSYDNFHEGAENIYRLEYKVLKKATGELYQKWAVSPFPLGPTLKENFQEVKGFARLRDPQLDAGEHVVRRGQKAFYEERIYFVDPAFLKMFSYKLLAGDVNTALNEPRSVVLTQSTSEKYFGDENPLGKELEFKHRTKTFNVVVTGLIEDIPTNSQLQFEMLASMETFYFEHTKEAVDNWYAQALYTFIELNPGVSTEEFESKSNELVEKYLPDWKREHHHIDYVLRPYRDVHLHSDTKWDIADKGNLQNLKFTFLLGIAVMIIGWVNYTNINIVSTIRRVKEFGVRKILGGENQQQTLQIGIEFSITFIFSIVVSLILVLLLHDKLNLVIGKSIPFILIHLPFFWIALIVVFVVGASIAAVFPYVIIKVIKPSIIVSGRSNFTTTKSGLTLRRLLVGLQFLIAIFFLIFSASVFNQISFMRAQELGYNLNNVIVMKGPLGTYDSTFFQRYDVLKARIAQSGRAESLAVSEDIPGYELTFNSYIMPYESVTGDPVSLYRNFIDENFFETYQLDIIAGSNFDRRNPSDKNKLIINESGLALLNFKDAEEAIGKEVLSSGNVATIAGVVSDHHQESLRTKLCPIVYFFDSSYKHPIYLSVRVGSGDLATSINEIESQWKSVFPDVPMDYFILSDRINKSYGNEKAFASTIETVTVFILALACLGIFALSYFEVLSSSKEIAIRKVMGSSTHAVFFQLVAKTIRILVISNAVAIPVCYFVIQQWLQGYEYRAPISILIFIAASIIVLAIVMLTISYHTAKAALMNPIDALRYE